MSDETRKHQNRDELLGELFDEFMERHQRGEAPSIDEYVKLYPEFGNDLRKLLEAMDAVGELREEPALMETSASTSREEKAPKILGDYRILREVGRGGMGVVYEAVQESLGRHVALKVLPYFATKDPTRLERFLREARAAAALHHSNIVPVFGIGDEDGVHFFAMQFIRGHSLDEVLEDVKQIREESAAGRDPTALAQRPASQVALSLIAGELELKSDHSTQDNDSGDGIPDTESPVRGKSKSSSSTLIHVTEMSPGTRRRNEYLRNTARIAVQVADALAYAHGEGVWHRDIKPSNLLLDARGCVWVTDFGLAKAEDSDELTHTGDILGTLPYMAPERFRGWTDPRSDVYSLGVTLYELSTLNPAFSEADRARLVHKVLHEEPPRPRRLEPNMPRDLETIILKSMEKEPASRYQSAEDLAADLRSFIADEPIRMRRTSVLERGWRWCRHNRALSVFVATTVLLLILISAAFLVMDRIRNERDEAMYWSHLADARSIRWSGRPGQRFESQRALATAAEVLDRLDLDPREIAERRRTLRNEFIACEALVDLEAGEEWPLPSAWNSRNSADLSLEVYTLISDDGVVSVHRLEDGSEIARIAGPSAVHQTAFSPDGLLLAIVYHEGGMRIWRWRRNEEILAIPGAEPCYVYFGPDSRLLASVAPDSSIRIHDLETAEPAGSFDLGLKGRDYIVRFSPGGERFAFRGHETGKVHLVHRLDSTISHELPHRTKVRSLAWHHLGTILAAACNDTWIYLWNSETGEALGRLQGHEAQVVHLSFQHAGDLLASYAWDETVRLWDPMNQRLLLTLEYYGTGPYPRFRPDDRSLACLRVAPGSEIVVAAQVQRLAPQIALRTFYDDDDARTGPWCIGISPDGRLLAAGGLDPVVRLWDLDSGRCVAQIKMQLGEIGTLLFHPSGDYLLTSGYQGLHRWPIVKSPELEGEVLRIGPGEILGHPPVTGAGWTSLSGDGRLLAAVDIVKEIGTVRLLDLDSGEERTLGEPDPGLTYVHLSPDGRWAATGKYGKMESKIWNVSTGELFRELDSKLARFSPDGRWLVATDHFAFFFFEGPDWKESHEIRRDPPGKMGRCIDFTRDGSLCAIAYRNSLVQLREPTTGEEIATLKAPTAHTVTELRFTPAGDRLIVATSAHAIQVWDLRHLRARLSEMGLDWNQPAIPAEGSRKEPLRIVVAD